MLLAGEVLVQKCRPLIVIGGERLGRVICGDAGAPSHPPARSTCDLDHTGPPHPGFHTSSGHTTHWSHIRVQNADKLQPIC